MVYIELTFQLANITYTQFTLIRFAKVLFQLVVQFGYLYPKGRVTKIAFQLLTFQKEDIQYEILF